MNVVKMLVLAGLMSSSVAAMAAGGGDIVAARMDAARDHAMAHYEQPQQQERALAAAHDRAKQQKAGS